jgi:hypothetical protein
MVFLALCPPPQPSLKNLFDISGILLGESQVNNKKCRFCGFINFAEAEACRKCEAVLDASANPAQPGPQTPGYASGYSYQYQYQPPAYNKSGSTIAKVLVGVGALIVVSLVIVVAVGAWSYKKHSKVVWREFRPGEPGLSVMMPGEPTPLDPIVTPTQMGEIKNYPYSSVVSGQGMTMFCIVSFPFSFSNYNVSLDKVLEGELASFLKRTDSTLISKHSLDEGQTKGLAFEFTTAGQKGFGKLVLGSNRLYFLSMVAAENSEMLEGKEKFLNATIPYD